MLGDGTEVKFVTWEVYKEAEFLRQPWVMVP